MSRTMPTECAHGRCIDWGDFGPPDEWGQGCEKCGIKPRPRCVRCDGDGEIWGRAMEGGRAYYQCPDCIGVGGRKA